MGPEVCQKLTKLGALIVSPISRHREELLLDGRYNPSFGVVVFSGGCISMVVKEAVIPSKRDLFRRSLPQSDGRKHRGNNVFCKYRNITNRLTIAVFMIVVVNGRRRKKIVLEAGGRMNINLLY